MSRESWLRSRARYAGITRRAWCRWIRHSGVSASFVPRCPAQLLARRGRDLGEPSSQERGDDVRERAADGRGESHRPAALKPAARLRGLADMAQVPAEQMVRFVHLHETGSAQRVTEGE